MTRRLPPRREMKFLAKRYLVKPVCLRATLLFVGVTMLIFGLRYLFGAVLTYGLVDLSLYDQTESGIYFYAEGFSLFFRMDLTDSLLFIPVTYLQLGSILLFGSIGFLIAAPLRLGTMERYWGALRGEEGKVKDLFRWFAEGKRFGKAVVVEFLLCVFVRGIGFVVASPALYLYYLFYTTTPTAESITAASYLYHMGGLLWAVAALLFTFWLHSVLLPVRYCLCAHPEYSLKQTFRRGLQSGKGYRAAFFRFRLSFVLWFFLAQMSYGVLNFFVLPYHSLGSMIFLQEAARSREGERMQPVASEVAPL